ncbi:MAG: TolC family outer membrane protein, partial [Ketobacter sp.]
MKTSQLKQAVICGAMLLGSTIVSAEVLTLQRTYELAQQNDPQWAAAKNTYQANQQVIDQNRSGLLPQINLTGNYRQNDVEYEDLGDDDYDSHGYSANLRQPLFRLDNWHTYKVGKALDSQYSAEFQNTTEVFYLRVVSRYLDVLRANANLTYRKAEQEAIARQLEQSKQRFEVGLVAITDVHEAQAAYDVAVSSRISAESDQFVALRLLETITGATVENVVDIRKDLAVTVPEPLDVNLWIERALANNANLQAAIYAAEAAQQNYKSQRGKHAPTLDLVGTHNYSSTDAQSLATGGTSPDTTSNIIGLELEIPLYSGGAISASRRQSQYQFLAAQDLEHQARRETIQDVTNFYQLTIANVAEVTARKQSTNSAKVALEATQAGYEAGTRTIGDV